MNLPSHVFISFLYLIIFLYSPALALEKELLKPHCGGSFDLCGYIDTKSKKTVIPKKFERANQFSEGLAGVRIKGKWGFINSSGNIISEPIFDLVGQFHHNMAEVMINDNVGVIDSNGKFLIKPQYARAIPFTKDVVLVKEGNWNNRHQMAFGYLRALVWKRSHDFGLYHLERGWLTKPKY